MKREVFFLIGANDAVLWSDASDSPLALPDSRARWEAIWSRRTEVLELAHSHPLGPEDFSAEDVSTMHALDDALGRRLKFSLVTPTQYLVRDAHDRAVPAPSVPAWVAALRRASGIPTLEEHLASWEAAGPTGDAEHRARLEALVHALRLELERTGRLAVLFVCTHNSRRSHLAQLLGLAAARHAGLPHVSTYSGGTEVTAFNARAVAALRRVGFEIDDAPGENPRYAVRFSSAEAPTLAFSKRITDPANPSAEFVAVMTCTQADAACPFVSGARHRVSLPYEDPKCADDTPSEAKTYDERVDQIGRDLVWVFRQVAAR